MIFNEETKVKDRIGLADLVGETIVDVEVVDYDHLGNGDMVDELYRITLASGKILHFLCDGGDCNHYGSISPVTLDKNGKVEGRYDPDLGEFCGNFESLKDKKGSKVAQIPDIFFNNC